MEFVNHSLKKHESNKKLLKNAKELGVTPSRAKASLESYISRIENLLSVYERRIKAFETAKSNIESLEHIFFTTGRTNPENFGLPIDDAQLYDVVIEGVLRATADLFGAENALRTNPHAFRHIGEKQVRKTKKDSTAFGMFIGHSETMGDDYAKQITSEYETTEGSCSRPVDELSDSSIKFIAVDEQSNYNIV